VISEAVILAAGKGERIRTSSSDLPKPLQEVAGRSLIKRTISTLGEAGVERVVVVLGFMADRVREALRDDPDYARAGIEIECVYNPEYELSNGVSVLRARAAVRGPFVLSMSDHVYDTHLAEVAVGADMSAADLYLCVDRRVAEVYDIDDATKVVTRDGKIVEIGKQLREYDAIDCGVFAVAPALFDCLEEVRREKGDCSLSHGVERLAAAGRARVADIGDAFWQDVDTAGARERADRVLGRR